MIYCGLMALLDAPGTKNECINGIGMMIDVEKRGERKVESIRSVGSGIELTSVENRNKSGTRLMFCVQSRPVPVGTICITMKKTKGKSRLPPKAYFLPTHAMVQEFEEWAKHLNQDEGSDYAI